MQKITLIILFFVLPLSIKAQQFSSQFGKIISSFDYKNSAGGELDNLHGSTNNYLEIGIKMPIRKSSFYFLSGIAYNRYGAEGSDDVLGNYFEWKLNYIGINLGAGYEFFKDASFLNVRNTNTEKGFTFYTQFSVAPEFLIQGTQTINNEIYNLSGVEQFDKPLFFVRGGIGAIYYASKTISVFAQYMGGRSFALLKSDSGDQEKLNIIAHTISTGLSISLPLYKSR